MPENAPAQKEPTPAKTEGGPLAGAALEAAKKGKAATKQSFPQGRKTIIAEQYPAVREGYGQQPGSYRGTYG